MEITFAPRGILQIDNARLLFRNFEGRGDKFNREGDRNFAVRIETQEDADRLLAEGWAVKIRPPREEGDEPFMYLPVKVKFNDFGPRVMLITNGKRNKLDEESVGMLDRIYIASADLDLRPFDWEVQGKTGRAAYLQTIAVVQEVDRFDERYAEEEYPEERPWD